MCLGIVGRVVGIDDAHPDLAQVDVAGAVRQINIGIIADEGVAAGDWILIHAGFAMQRIDAETAANQTAVLREYTGGPPAAEADDDLADEMDVPRAAAPRGWRP